MKAHTFKGGIHPEEMKELSNQCPITAAFPKSKTVTIPVTMGGAPNTPLVKVGDLVAKGQKIAASDKFMSAPVHASIAGKVKKIANCLVTGNMSVPCIVIESDDSDRTEFMSPLDPFKCTHEEALERIKEAGIVGMGGASFPTHVKLNPPEDKEIEYVLVNAADTLHEPLADTQHLAYAFGKLPVLALADFNYSHYCTSFVFFEMPNLVRSIILPKP